MKGQDTTIRAFSQHSGLPPIFQALNQALGMQNQALGMQNQMRHGLLREAFSVEEKPRKVPLEVCPRAYGNIEAGQLPKPRGVLRQNRK